MSVRLARKWSVAATILLAVATRVNTTHADKQTDRAVSNDAPGPANRRTPWTLSRVRGSPDAPSPFRYELAFPHLKFTRPVEIMGAPGTNRLFVAELDGKIYSFPNDPSIQKPDLCIDIRKAVPAATNFYGLTFHPDFARNRLAFVCYVLKEGDPNGTRVSRFVVSRSDPPTFDAASETVLMTWFAGGHNGGCLKFGRDGCLYIATGDGTAPSPPDGLSTGQDLDDLLSCILRIDVAQTDPGKAYHVPADNPFVATAGARPEIWAYGFRNPWKMSFDRETGELWTGDVGWELWEMVYRVQRGGNYGWSVMEGRQPVRTELERGPTPILPPIVDHPHTEAASITGGYVYRGKKLKDLQGAYIYGDYVTGKIWGLRHDGSQVRWHAELLDSPLQIICFGEDNAGELYVLDYEYSGKIYRLEPNAATNEANTFPRLLSQTGLFHATRDHAPAAGVIPYVVNAELWNDHATAERFLAIPGNATIEFDPTKYWKFPEGTVLAKTYSLELEAGNPKSRRRIESQLLHFEDATWRPYSYKWTDDQSDAALVDAGGDTATLVVHDATAPGKTRRHEWRFASRTECLLCHNPWAGHVLGFQSGQLNRSAVGGSASNQIADLRRVGVFTMPATWQIEKLSRLCDPYDSAAAIDLRARSYLHANCAHCHRFGGGGTATIDLDFSVNVDKTGAIGQRPSQGTFGISGARIISPGDPFGSVLWYRMAKLGPGRMPRAGAAMIDTRASRLIHDWIVQLEPALSKKSATAGVNDDRDAPTLRELQLLPSDKRTASIRQLLTSTRGGMMMLQLMDSAGVSSAESQTILSIVKSNANTEVRDLFERFLPESDRIRRIGTVIDPAAILARSGDADRGRRVFFENASAQCKTCHKIGNQGGSVGPDLTHIGSKHRKAALLDQILDPSREMETPFVPYLLERRDGSVICGVLVEKNDKRILLRDAADRLIVVPATDVVLLAPQAKSLMPEFLMRDLTAQEVADLVEFLVSQK